MRVYAFCMRRTMTCTYAVGDRASETNQAVCFFQSAGVAQAAAASLADCLPVLYFKAMPEDAPRLASAGLQVCGPLCATLLPT